MRPSLSLLLSSFIILPLAISTLANPIEPRADCRKPQVQPSSECYISLDVTEWLQDWWSKNKANCNTDDFSSCFQFQHGIAGQSCSNNTKAGCPSVNSLDYPNDPEAFYVLWNLYSINSYFSDYWQAVGNANSILEPNVLHLIQQFNPPKTSNLELNGILVALGAVLSFAAVPNVAKEISDAAKDAATALFAAINAAPGVARFLFPQAGTTESVLAQLGEVGHRVSGLVNDYQHNITSALQETNGNFDSFLALAKTTAFSNPVNNIQYFSDSILQALYTYIISQIMSVNNIAVASGDLKAVNAAGSAGTTPDFTPTAGGIQGDTWIDGDTQKAYSMNSLGDLQKSMTDVMVDVFNNKYTTPELLFLGTEKCNAGQPSLQLPSSSSASFAVNCLSRAQYCTYEPTKIASDKEFTNCKTQTGFGDADCPGNAEGNSPAIRLPVGYVGAYDNVGTDTCQG